MYLYEEKKYENGEISYFDYCDWEMFSRFSLEEMAVELGYELPIGFWWRPYGNLVRKGGMLSDDDSIRAMIFDMKRRQYRQVDVFLVPPDPSISSDVKKNPVPSCTIEELRDDVEVIVDVVVNPIGYPEGGVHVQTIIDSTDEENEDGEQDANDVSEQGGDYVSDQYAGDNVHDYVEEEYEKEDEPDYW